MISEILRLALFSCLTCLLMSSASAVQMPGGAGPTQPADASIQKLVDSVKAVAESKFNEDFSKFEAISYRSQLVNGVNYFVKVNVGNANYVHLRIYKGFGENAAPVLSAMQTGKKADDELSYFEK